MINLTERQYELLLEATVVMQTAAFEDGDPKLAAEWDEIGDDLEAMKEGE